MNSQQLLYINLVIALFFVLYFFFFRTKPKQPTRLNLRANSMLSPPELKEKPQVEVLEPEVKAPALEPVPVPVPEPIKVQAKNRRIFFVYNGHEWECHEVLGLEQGCSIQQATEMYQHLIKTSDPSTFEFYEAAYTSILKRKGEG